MVYGPVATMWALVRMAPAKWPVVVATLAIAGCASTTGRTAWVADDIRRAASIWEGCWTFRLVDADVLSDPLSDDSFEFPLGDGASLTGRETADVWAGFEGVRQPVAFEVDVTSRPHLAAYWVPHPPGRRFTLKWRDESSASDHITMIVDDTPVGPRGVVSLRGAHIGVVLDPQVIVAARCGG